jgi:hypothetical protein
MKTSTGYLFVAAAVLLLIGAFTTGCDTGGGGAGYAGPSSSGVYTACERVDGCFEAPENRLSCDHGDGTSEDCVPWPKGCGDTLTCACAGDLICGDRECVERRPFELFCVGEAAPSCDGHGLDEQWELGDGCNGCLCTLLGAQCSDRPCPGSCGSYVDEYEALVAGAKACAVDADCQLLSVDCQMLNRCDEYVNLSLTAGELDARTDAWLEASCNDDSFHSCCDAGIPPRDAVCLDGICAPEPEEPGPCGDGIHVGATDRAVGCNVCSCSEAGLDCTDHGCPETCDAVAALWETVLPSIQACASGDSCTARFGPAWVTGLGDCWVPVNSKSERTWSDIVEAQWFELGCHGAPQPCAPDAAAECANGVCVLVL